MTPGKATERDIGNGTAPAPSQIARKSRKSKNPILKMTIGRIRPLTVITATLATRVVETRVVAAMAAAVCAPVLRRGTNQLDHASLLATKSHGTEPALLFGNIGRPSPDI